MGWSCDLSLSLGHGWRWVVLRSFSGGFPGRSHIQHPMMVPIRRAWCESCRDSDKEEQRGCLWDTQSTDSTNFSPQKKMKLRGTKDLSIAAVGKYGTLQEFSFFDKVTLGA